MIKKTITYTDFNDVPRTEDFYFNLTQTEIMHMEDEEEGGLSKKLEGIAKMQDVRGILRTIEWVIQKAYGIRSEDGRRFIKNSSITEEFVQTPAYQELYMSFLEDPDSCVEFINGLVPKLPPKLAQAAKEQGISVPN